MAEQSKVVFESLADFSKVSLGSVEAGNLKFCEIWVTQAKPLAPVDEGQLANSIQFVTGTGKKGGLNDNSQNGRKKGSGNSESFDEINIPLTKKEAAFGATAKHAVPQEFGTKFMAPQPYARPAIAITKGAKITEIIKAIDREVKNGILKGNKKRETFGL